MGLCLLLACGSAQRFNWLGPIEVRAVSNASIVAGKGSNDTGGVRAVRAHRRLGAELQGTLGGNHSETWSITGNGLTVVGFSTLSNGALRAYRQQPLGGLQNLGVLAGNTDDPYYWSEARDVSADGKTVVGRSIDAQGRLRAFRWSEADGMQDLGTLGGVHSGAYGVSADGSTIVGYADDAQGRMRPFRWTQSGGMHDLGTFGGSIGDAWATSADGQIVVGAAHNAQGQWRAFRWTPTDGLEALPGLGGAESGVRDISADGKVMVGLARNAQGQWRAVRWTAAGVQDLTQAYASLIGQGSYLEVAQGVSANGRYIVGHGYNAATQRTEAYILETEPPRPGTIRLVRDSHAFITRFKSVSWDGQVVVGVMGSLIDEYEYNLTTIEVSADSDYALRWTPSGGLQVIASPGIALDVSASGRYIVGAADTSNGPRAFYWTEQDGFQFLPEPSDAHGLTTPALLGMTCATAVGDPFAQNPFRAYGDAKGEFRGVNSYCPSSAYYAPDFVFVWLGINGLVGLTTQYCNLPRFTVTDCFSGNGNGFSLTGFTGNGAEPVVQWRIATSLGTPSAAWSVGSDYRIAVGMSGSVAVRWEGPLTIIPLGTLPNNYPGWLSACAHGISGDSKVIVGSHVGGVSFVSQLGTAWRYTDEDGMEDLNDTYAHLLRGVFDGNDARLFEARATSWDGRYIVGSATSTGGGPVYGFWLDTWREGDTNGDGCVDDADLLRVLFAFGTVGTAESPWDIPLRHEDINHDGIVDDADLLLVLFNFASGCGE
jgi:probable HAF family extracellular repeat protein